MSGVDRGPEETGQARVHESLNSAAESSADPNPFSSLAVADPVVLVLADADTPAARSNARGHLFERFAARLLHLYGYSSPSTERLNVTQDGIEIDVVARHEITGLSAIVECKAYTNPLSAAQLGAFHSKLVTARFQEPNTQGFFIGLPRLTASGQERADLIEANDNNFKVLTTADVVSLLRSRGIVSDLPGPARLTSDFAIIITEHGVASACLELNAESRLPSRVLVWDTNVSIPTAVLELVSASDYAQGLPVDDPRATGSNRTRVEETHDDGSIIVTVAGSSSDFEYQLPASPKFFVGRRQLLQSLSEVLDRQTSVLVLNAQSGWGKSSAALRLQDLNSERRGFSMVIDSRTALSRRFVVDTIRLAARQASAEGTVSLPEDASWASLASSLHTLARAEWHAGSLLLFFDQFENVFRDEALTREFRDLALGAGEMRGNLIIGFAWKTDLVGWTESHPYQLRDEIRSSATVLSLGPFGASEIETLLRRLERALEQGLARDLRTRLREYSQGLPWLFKKLAGHLLREVQLGATQEQLAAEALNVQNLFDADLAELGPVEQEALRHIARFAPVAISEVLERISPAILETLVNRRLVVQVGERIDTYWDIFRDYLNTGRIPIEDSYILRQSPNSVARLLSEVANHNGDGGVVDIASGLGTSENAIFNLSRELRLLGTTAYEPNRVRMLPEIWGSSDPEAELRQRVAAALRRHRAFTTFSRLAERNGEVFPPLFALELAGIFPAVEVRDTTWQTYARVFLQWFEYAGLAVARGSQWSLAPEGTKGKGELLRGQVKRRSRGAWPQRQARPAIDVLIKIADGEVTKYSDAPREVRDLIVLGAVVVEGSESLQLSDRDLVVEGAVDRIKLRGLMNGVAGVAEGLSVIEQDGSAHPELVGLAIQQALGAVWAPGTVLAVGKQLRSWARYAGISVERSARATNADKRSGCDG